MSFTHRHAGRAALAALAAGTLLTTAACGSDSGDSSSSSKGGSTTMTFWTNATTGPGQEYFKQAIATFEKDNPKVKIKMQIVQNEDLDGKLQSALQAGKGTAPDIFLQRGGGKLADMQAADQLGEITASSDAQANIAQSTLDADTIDGKLYAMPLDLLPGGFFYSKDALQKAGISTPPTTNDELTADAAKLKAAGVPIALGAKDAWPAAHWFYWYALRECSQETLADTAKTKKFDDDCWTRAGDDLKTFADTKPFNEGFLNTSAQQGAGSSAGLIANRKASMELMGAWDPGQIGSLTPDKQPLPDLSFFPFPSVSGGEGDPNAIMGGIDGYSCSKWAPQPACSDFLNFLVTAEQNTAYAAAFFVLPVNKQSQAQITDPVTKQVLDVYNKAPYSSIWLDTVYGSNVGTALNTAVVNMLAGKGSVADIIKAVNDAAAKG
jgi:raffinose/stachyose/melibiose transport system substrate-binding protein